MIAKLKAYFLWLWNNHIQKVMGYIGGALMGLDLSGYAESIKAFAGAKGYHAVVLICLVITTIRAHQK